MKEILQILNLRLVYNAHWVGMEDGKVKYDCFYGFGGHEIEARYLPKELHKQLVEFIEKVEHAHDEKDQS